MKIIKELNLSSFLVIAIIIRLLVMPFYSHPDIKVYNFQSSFLGQGVVNIYSYLTDNRDKLPYKDGFVYFPLTYFTLGSYQIIIQPLLGQDFNKWLVDPSQNTEENAYVFRYLFLLKVPYLILDIGIAFLLLFLFQDRERQKKAFIFWLFNPFTIILIYIYNNIDIFPVFLTVLGLVLAKQYRIKTSALTLGIATGFKVYPFLFLPFLVMMGRSFKERIIIILIALGTLLAIILPFMNSTGFRETALISGLTTRIISYGLPIGFGEMILPGIVSITALCFFMVSKKKFSFDDLWEYQLCLLLLIFSFIHFHIQWLLWLMPLVTLVIVSKKEFTVQIILLLTTAFMIPLLYEDKFMTVSLLSNISPFYNLLPMPFSIIQRIYDPYALENILQSALVGGSLMFTWQILRKERI